MRLPTIEEDLNVWYIAPTVKDVLMDNAQELAMDDFRLKVFLAINSVDVGALLKDFEDGMDEET